MNTERSARLRLECLACRLLHRCGVTRPPVPVEVIAQDPLSDPDYSALFREVYPAEAAPCITFRDQGRMDQASRRETPSEAGRRAGDPACYAKDDPEILPLSLSDATDALDVGVALASPRQRFALGRELLCTCACSGWLAEPGLDWTWAKLDADYFARCLLMPGAWFVRDHACYGPALHQRYAVPEVQALRRCHELELAAPIEVLIAEASAGMLAGLAHILEGTLAARVAGQARSREQTLQLIGEQRADVALVDPRLVAGDEATLRAAVQGDDRTRLIMLVDPRDSLAMQRVAASGAWGCLSREAPREAILEAVRAVAAGERYFDSALSGVMLVGLSALEGVEEARNRGPVESGRWRVKGDELIMVGDLTIDVERRQAIRQGQPILLTRLEFDLLAYLARHRGRVVSYEELLEQVWGYAPGDSTSKLVQLMVRRLRLKLGDDPAAPRYIANVRGVGYRLL